MVGKRGVEGGVERGVGVGYKGGVWGWGMEMGKGGVWRMKVENGDGGWRGLAGTEMENEGSRIEMGSEKEGGGARRRACGLSIFVIGMLGWKERGALRNAGQGPKPAKTARGGNLGDIRRVASSQT